MQLCCWPEQDITGIHLAFIVMAYQGNTVSGISSVAAACLTGVRLLHRKQPIWKVPRLYLLLFLLCFQAAAS